MAIRFVCPNPKCGKALKVRDELAGLTRPCPACGVAVPIPRAEESVEVEVVATPVLEQPVEPVRPLPRRSAVEPTPEPEPTPAPAPAAGGGMVGPLLVGGMVALGLYALSVVLPWYTVSFKGDGLFGAGAQSSGSIPGIKLATAVAGLIGCLGALGFVAWAWLKQRELLVLATRVAAGASLVAFCLALGQVFRAGSGSSEGGLAGVLKLAIEVRSAVGIYLAMVASVAAGAVFGLLGTAFRERLRRRQGTEVPAGGKGAEPVRAARKVPVGAWIGAGVGLLVLAAGGGVGYWLMMPRVHLENLPKVRSGMTLAEVEELLGPGEVVSTTDLPWGKRGKPSVSRTVRWHAEKEGGEQEVSLTFLDGKVMMGFGPKEDAPAAGTGSDVMSKMEAMAKEISESPEFKAMLSSTQAATSPGKGASPALASRANSRANAGARQQAAKGRTRPSPRELPGAITDLDGALAGLKSGGLDQLRALDWLIATPPVDARREEVITALTPLVDGQGVLDRPKAAGALAAWSGPAQLDLLVRELDQSDEGVRRAVLGALGRLRDPRAAPAIAQRLLVPADRGDAGRALMAIGAEAAPVVQPFLQSQDRAVRSEAAQVLRMLGALNADAALMLALADLRDRDHGVRVRALQDLARATPSPTDPHRAETAAILVGLLNDPQMSIRVEAAKALVAWAVPDNVPVLLDALGAQDGDLRRAAMEALGCLGDRRAVPWIARRLLDGGDRAQATRSLQRLGPMAEAETLRYLQHRDGAVRAAACRVLRSAGTRKSVQPLRYIAGNDRDRESARAAVEALEGIARRRSAK